jgi:2',3'-cyclic-nucleotide 2'-phosphodiesterase (5'-nucleotidase family)
MQRFIILHSNDIHGRIHGLARIATLVDKIRQANPDIPIFYFDAGDIEENSVRLSNLTKGVALYRLLRLAGCDIETIGNGGITRYGYQVLADYAKAADYPLLLANLRLPDHEVLPGVQSTILLNAGTLRLGIIGVTAPLEGAYDDFGLVSVPVVPLIKECSSQLLQAGAEVIIVLSHLGLKDDTEIADFLQDDVSLIIGAHSHDLLPEGGRNGRVFIAQAGQYAEHLGKLDLIWDGTQLIVEKASVIPVTEDIEPSYRVLREVETLEQAAERFLEDVICEIAEPLDYASDRECRVVNVMADMLRERMHADVAIITSGAAFSGPLPAGPLRRVYLWDVCNSPGNPGVVAMKGAQLLEVVQRGLDPEFAKDTPKPLRALARGLIHLSGASIKAGKLFVGDQPVDLEKEYRVAGSDWELSPYGGYVLAEWKLQPQYEVPTILREALEEYLRQCQTIYASAPRLRV